MAGITRVKRTPGDFFQAYKPTFQNEKLSFAARGLLAYLCTKPDNWEVMNEDLINASPGGKAALQTILKELRAAGHIRRIARKKPNGNFDGWDTEIYENPKDNPDYNATDIPISGKTENPTDQKAERPKTGKRKEIIMSLTKNDSTTTGKPASKSQPPEEDPISRLINHYTQLTGKQPRGLITAQKWEDYCQTILDQAEGDVARAEGLMSESFEILKERGYSYNGPNSLIKTIDGLLKSERKGQQNDRQNGHSDSTSGTNAPSGRQQRPKTTRPLSRADRVARQRTGESVLAGANR